MIAKHKCLIINNQGTAAVVARPEGTGGRRHQPVRRRQAAPARSAARGRRVPANGVAAAARPSQWRGGGGAAQPMGGGGAAGGKQRRGRGGEPAGGGAAAALRELGPAASPRSAAALPGPPAPHRPPQRLSMYDNLYLHGFEDSEAVSAAGAGRAGLGWVSALRARRRG